MDRIKRSIVLVLIIMMLSVPVMNSYATETSVHNTNKYKIPVTVTSLTKDINGKVEQYFSPGDHMIIEYTITPQDIPLVAINNNKPIDIALVVDTSGSMNDSSGSFDNWLAENAKYYYEFDDFLCDNAKPVNNEFDNWLKIHTNKLSYNDWFKKCKKLSFQDWLNLSFTEETFDEWIIAENIEYLNKFWQYYGKYVREIKSSYNDVDYMCLICGEVFENLYSNYYYSNVQDHYYYNYRNKYNYPSTDITSWLSYNDLKSLWNSKSFDEKIYITDSGERKTTAEIRSIYDELQPYSYNSIVIDELNLNNYFEKNHINDYIYNGKVYTENELCRYWTLNYANKFMFNSRQYSKSELMNIWKYKKYYYKGQLFNRSELKTIWNNNFTTKIQMAKSALKEFVNVMKEADNANDIDVSIITFENCATNYMAFTNVKDSSINSCIEGISANGGTNGGDGLRMAYHKFIENNKSNIDKDLYIIYMADGQNYAWTQDNNQYYYGNYDGYINKDSNTRYYAYDNNRYIYWMYNESSSYGPNYAYNVAKLINNSDSNIKTYVVGVGDGVSKRQSDENKNICANANFGKYNDNSADIGDLYFPVDDTSKLESLYNEIANKIIENILVEDIKFEVPFNSPIKYKSVDKSSLNIVGVKVNGENYDVLSVIDNKLTGKLPEFVYTIDEKKNVYKADSMVVSIEIVIPDDFEGILETLDTDLIYTALKERQNADIPTVHVEVINGIKPFKVDSELHMRSDGTAQLNYTPVESSSGTTDYVEVLSRKVGLKSSYSNVDYIVPLAEVLNGVNTINLTKDQLKDFVDNTIYIEAIKSVKIIGDNGAEERTLKGISEVTILSNGNVVYNKDNYTSSIEREVGIKFSSPNNNLNNIVYKSDVSVLDTNVPVYSDGQFVSNMILKSGNNNMTVIANNSFGNKTIYEFNVNVNCKLPVIESKVFKTNNITVRYTDSSNDMKKTIVRIYDGNGNLKKSVDAIRDKNDSKKFTVDFNSNIVTASDIIEIDGLDIVRNGIVKEFKFASLIDHGLYKKSTNEFFTGIPNVVNGCRYTYGVKFVYNGQDKMILSSEVENLKITGFGAIIKELDTNNVLTESSNKFKMIRGESCVKIDKLNLVNGKEYLLLFDIVFSSDEAVNNPEIELELELGTESDVKSVVLKELPQVE